MSLKMYRGMGTPRTEGALLRVHGVLGSSETPLG